MLTVYLCLLLYIVLTISILIGQQPPAYFENSRDFVDMIIPDITKNLLQLLFIIPSKYFPVSDWLKPHA